MKPIIRRIRQDECFVVLSEDEINEILIEAVAAKAGFTYGADAKKQVFHGSRDRCGSAGVERYAKVTITNNYADEPQIPAE